MTTTDQLLAAGRTLATLAEPGRDLDALGSDMLEIADTLKLLGKGMQRAFDDIEEDMEGRRLALREHGNGYQYTDIMGRAWTRDAIDLWRDNELKRERATALRTAQKALVQLAALIDEMQPGSASL